MVIDYVVKVGDTLWQVAREHNTTVTEIKNLNNLIGDLILPGQILAIPVSDKLNEMELAKDSHPLPSIEGGFQLPSGEHSQGEIRDIELLARLVYAEARGEPFEGQIAVAAVVLNRLNHPQFPDTIREIIYQKTQFETVANGTINLVPDYLAYQAVLEAMEGNDPTDGSLFFWNPRKVGPKSWVWTLAVKKQIGEHVFA